MSEILPSSGLGPGSDDLGHKSLNLLYLLCHPQKAKPKTKIFFIANLKTCQGFEQLSSTISQQVMELLRDVRNCGSFELSRQRRY